MIQPSRIKEVQFRWLPSMDITNTPCLCSWHNSRDSVGHPVRPQSPHHAHLLERVLVLPFTRKLLLLRTLTVSKLLPAFCRSLKGPCNNVQLAAIRDPPPILQIYRHCTSSCYALAVYYKDKPSILIFHT